MDFIFYRLFLLSYCYIIVDFRNFRRFKNSYFCDVNFVNVDVCSISGFVCIFIYVIFLFLEGVGYYVL